MAITFDYVILPHQKKQDGTNYIRIRVTHNRKSKYIKTNIAVEPEDLTRSGNLKNEGKKDLAKEEIKKMRRVASQFSHYVTSTMDVGEIVELINTKLKKHLPKYSYPPHIITSSWVGILSRLGIEFSVPVAESEGISGLDSQKASGKAIYGKGYIVSDRVKAEREKAERWTLSDRELAIIHRLNQQHHENE